MSSDNKFGMLRKLLRALGLSQQSADDVVNFIVDLLAGERSNSSEAADQDFPYQMRENFLTPAELSFYHVLKAAVSDQFIICTKVGLGDIFAVKKDDPSRFRIYTNKIDRKHVDFLLCEPKTMHPRVAIELDDKSHQRKDRQERDAFVDEVFKAAELPLVHIPVQRAYKLEDINTQIGAYLKTATLPVELTQVEASQTSAPACPKCGSEMILRTAKKGENAGQQFWGCSNYPACRAMLPIKDAKTPQVS